MKKVPFAFKNTVRKVYFNLLRNFVEEEGLILNLGISTKDNICVDRILRSPEIIAIIDSHSSWGEPDDLTNEPFLNERTYDGLKITIKNNKYRQQIDKIAKNMKNNLEEDVVIKDWSSVSDDERFKIVND